jgi:hypothetical protein
LELIILHVSDRAFEFLSMVAGRRLAGNPFGPGITQGWDNEGDVYLKKENATE